MLPVCSTSSRCAIGVSGEGPSGAFGMRDHNVSVDQGVVRRAIEAAVQPGLLDFQLAVVFGPSPGPRRLVHLRRADESSRPADPSKDVAEGVVTTDNEATNPACERMEAIGVERFRALSSCTCFGCVLGEVPTSLVSATGILAPETQRDSEP